jgi:Putative Actinobacterial Holin-X, holin superfamily III
MISPDAAFDPPPSSRRSEPELKAIVSDLWQNSERLVQQELQLALSELNVRLSAGKVALRSAAIAGGLFQAAYLTALAALVLLLAELIVPWLAALLVAVVAGAGAYLFSRLSGQAARRLAEPRDTHESLMSPRQSANS